MPDLLRDEETETRTHSLCLFNVSGANRNNRCENCPRAAGSRALYQQRGCPLDDVEQNIFGTVGAAAGGISESSDPKLLATSSKLQHGPEVVANIFARISLGGRARRFDRRSRSDLGISSSSVDMTVAVGAKRKADHEPEGSLRIDKLADVYIGASHNQTEALQNATSDELGVVSPRDGSSDIDIERTQQNKRPNLLQGSDNNLADVPHLFSSLSIRTEGDDHHSKGDHVSTSVGPQVLIDIEAKAADSLSGPGINSFVLNRTELGGGDALTEVDVVRKFKDGSSDVENYLRNKPPIIFQDLQKDEPLYLSVYPAVPASEKALLNSVTNDSIMQLPGHHSGKALSVDIRIASIGMITERQGVPPCSDGVFDPCDPEEGSPMIAEEIFELSIDQIEELRQIDDSSFL